MSRADALARLAAAYARHQVRRRFQRPSPHVQHVLDMYGPDHLSPLTPEERRLLPEISRCINCGICAIVAGRVGKVRLPDAASGYLRAFPLLPSAAFDLEGDKPSPAALQAATAACPVGVPVEGVAAMIQRLTHP